MNLLNVADVKSAIYLILERNYQSGEYLLENNKSYNFLPMGADLEKDIEPIYEIFEGWHECTVGISSLEKLPKNAIYYIKSIEKYVGCPAYIVSTSPNRNDIIEIKNPFER